MSDKANELEARIAVATADDLTAILYEATEALRADQITTEEARLITSLANRKSKELLEAIRAGKLP